jgi:hypothetical protein
MDFVQRTVYERPLGELAEPNQRRIAKFLDSDRFYSLRQRRIGLIDIDCDYIPAAGYADAIVWIASGMLAKPTDLCLTKASSLPFAKPWLFLAGSNCDDAKTIVDDLLRPQSEKRIFDGGRRAHSLGAFRPRALSQRRRNFRVSESGQRSAMAERH